MDYFVKPVDGKALLERLDKYVLTSKDKNEETRILVVDDEPANVQWLAGILRPAGFSVMTAYGGGMESGWQGAAIRISSSST